MMAIFDLLAVPLGWILWAIYKVVPNYFLAIFLFTLLIRLVTFPLSLKQQKSTADRARLGPRLDRLQKKYGEDRKKLQEKQMELYQKENVSMTGGCLPTLVQMIVLFGVISVIYKPVTYLARVPADVVDAAVAGVQMQVDENGAEIPADNKLSANVLKGYYKELKMMQALDDNEQDVEEAIAALSPDKLAGKTAEQYVEEIKNIRDHFTVFGLPLLENPWQGFDHISWLWLLPLLSALTAACTSLLTTKYNKPMTDGQPGQGCTNGMMVGMMPLFSGYIAFIVPGGVGLYWICSNLIALLQTFVLNKIYNPAAIRAQAEIEYEERRRRKAEDKARLAESRRKEQAEIARLNNQNKETSKKGGKPPKKASESNLSDPSSTSDGDALPDNESEKGKD